MSKHLVPGLSRSLLVAVLALFGLCGCAGTTTDATVATPTEPAAAAHDEIALLLCEAWIAGYLRGEDVPTWYGDDASYEESQLGESYKDSYISLVPGYESVESSTVRIEFTPTTATRDPVRELITCRGHLSASDSDATSGMHWSAEHEVAFELQGLAPPAARRFTVVPLELRDSANNSLVRTSLGCMNVRAGAAPAASVCQYEVESRDAYGVYRSRQLAIFDAQGFLVDGLQFSPEYVLGSSYVIDTFEIEGLRALDLGQDQPAVAFSVLTAGRYDDGSGCAELARLQLTYVYGWREGYAQPLLEAITVDELRYPSDPSGALCGASHTIVRNLELAPRPGEPPGIHVTVVRSDDPGVPIGQRDIYAYDSGYYTHVETIDPTAP